MEGEVKLADVEITLSAWVQAKWFRLLATGTRMLILPVITAVGMLILGLQGDVRQVQETQALRAEASEENFAGLRNELGTVQSSQDVIAKSQVAMQRQLDTIEGILEGMNRPRVGQLLP